MSRTTRKPARKPIGPSKPQRRAAAAPPLEEVTSDLRMLCRWDGGSKRDPLEVQSFGQSVHASLLKLSKEDLVSLCDTFHVDGRTYAQLRRMSKASLATLLVNECTPASRSAIRNEV